MQLDGGESGNERGSEAGTSSALDVGLGPTNPVIADQQEKAVLTETHPSSIGQAGRIAVAAVGSLLIARFFHLQEAYWSAITTVIVMQSTLGAALPISVRRLIGTAVGAVGGAVVDLYFPGNAVAFGVSVFVTGVLCALVRVQRGTFRYASITLAIVVLATRGERGWFVAADRFFEVSIGIGMGLVVCAVWPESNSETNVTKS